jgi:hypothetical protein
LGVLHYWAYQPTILVNKSVDDIYKMTQEERKALFNHYIECKSEELNNKIKIESQLAALRAEEERVRIAQVAAEHARTEERERSAMRERAAAERARIQERDRLNESRRIEERRIASEQERQARHNNALEGMHVPAAPIGMRPSAPAQPEFIVVDMQPSAPVFDEAEQDNGAPNTEQGVCCIGSNNCTEEQGVAAIPCKNKHSDLICKACLAQIKNSTNLCPLCRTKLS